MRKLVVLIALVAASALTAGACYAQACEKAAVNQKEVMVDRDGDGVTDGVDIFDNSGKLVKRGYDTDNDMMVDKWESYDENTGLPVVVQSDTAFELR